MTSNVVDDVDADIDDVLSTELAKATAGDSEQVRNRIQMPVAQNTPEPPARLPRRIAGGFRGLGDDLDRRARDLTDMVRLLEQQRPQLESAEAERDRLYEALGRIVPAVQESGRALKDMLETTKTGDVSGDLATRFTKSLNAIEELENVAAALTANLLWIRSTWEQYAWSIIRAQKMREELKPSTGER